MSSVPRPLIAVLAVAVLFFALWTVALKHTLTGGGGGSAGNNSPSAPALQSALTKAKGLQAVVNSAAGKAGGTPGQSVSPTTAPSAPTTTQSAPTTTTTAHVNSTSAQKSPTHAGSSAAATSKSPTATAPVLSLPHSRPSPAAVVAHALQNHKVLALLVYNPAASDDRAVNDEMKKIPTRNGKVVKLSVRVQDLGSFSSLLNEVPVNFSPTLVLIDRNHQADEIAGFADSYEIAQRVDAALRVAPAKQSKQ